jgi:NitT/TauT family transport system ATP-binding protein
MSAMVRFDDVSLCYCSLPVIEHLSFEVKRQDVIGILGPSGVGKSTLLKLIAGIEQPTGGRIYNNSMRIGYVFQEPRTLPWKTAIENIMLPLLALKMNKKEAKERSHYYLNKMGLRDFSDYYPSQLSGGMVQRISLALLDEPFSGLDVRLLELMLTMLEGMLTERPITALHVSHSHGEVVRLANRIFMFFPGGILEEQGSEAVRSVKTSIGGNLFKTLPLGLGKK